MYDMIEWACSMSSYPWQTDNTSDHKSLVNEIEGPVYIDVSGFMKSPKNERGYSKAKRVLQRQRLRGRDPPSSHHGQKTAFVAGYRFSYLPQLLLPRLLLPVPAPPVAVTHHMTSGASFAGHAGVPWGR